MTSSKRLLRSSPESMGISSNAILSYIVAAEQAGQELHSFMLLRKGSIVAEGWWQPYSPEIPHMLYSLSKSFTSSAAGLAIEEGLISLDDLVLKYFPDEKPVEVSTNLAAMQLRHLLSMSTGHDQDATGNSCGSPDGNWARGFLSLPVDHVPGTHFVYNSAATYMVAAIVEKVTGMGLLAYLHPRLLDPLGIMEAVWETCPRGIVTGGWGLNIRTEDIAAFGQLYLQKGVWNGKRILSEEWVSEATSKQVENGSDPDSDWQQGYGYQFWRSRHNAFRGDGAFGQYCIVLPDEEVVIAVTSGLGDMQAPLNTIWEYLIPAFQSESLPADSAANAQLNEKLTSLLIPVPNGKSDLAAFSELTEKTYHFAENEMHFKSVALSQFGEDITITFVNDIGSHSFVCGIGKRASSSTTFLMNAVLRPSPSKLDWKSAAYGSWTSENTFTIKLCLYETPFTPVFTFQFFGNELKLSIKGNIGFGPSEWPTLSGKL